MFSRNKDCWVYWLKGVNKTPSKVNKGQNQGDFHKKLELDEPVINTMLTKLGV